MTEIIFLGTNGWFDGLTGNTICVLIRAEEYYIILDAGNGLHKIDRYLTTERPIFLFLSHFHLDHIVGLHILNKFDFTKGLRIYGPAGTKDIMNLIINRPFTIPLTELSFNVEIFDLPEKEKSLPFCFESQPMFHSSLTLGFRFEIDRKVISYCPDTGYCENALRLARNADLLIAECSYKSGQINSKWPHLNPETAANIAKEAQCKRLALIHFDASIYQNLEERKAAEKEAKKIFSNTFAAVDDMQVEI